MGTNLGVLGESFPMNTNMTGFRWFSKRPCEFHASSPSIGRVKVIDDAELEIGVKVSKINLFSIWTMSGFCLRCAKVLAQVQNHISL